MEHYLQRNQSDHRYGTLRLAGGLTGLSDTKDLTQDEGELDAAPGKRTLVFVFPTAVL